MSKAPSFAPGDRVLMVKHADWKQDAHGTIAGPGWLRQPERGFTYVVVFDSPQSDYTDELNGDFSRTYPESTVEEQFLQPLGCKGPVPKSVLYPMAVASIERQIREAISRKPHDHHDPRP